MFYWVFLALSEGRGEARCEVGLAVINVSQPHLILCQISDTQSYDNTLRKINIFNPSQVKSIWNRYNILSTPCKDFSANDFFGIGQSEQINWEG